ncbi:hypothetical protein JEO87_03675 [Acinetobacter pittii]|uniref:hypothetical protein n=1 Tax=Acinetobacter calcoaceticus/baumannii complex TaxID=909768 RepID=UPI0018FFB571|nr:hypothetical protein [Acinetobacter pittii]MBK0409621.1 hypothetical protein [Acinetobacter pittii]MBK1417340.1 hypothetical protein [Acinetobacter pittii]
MEPATFPITSFSGVVQVINYLNTHHSNAIAEGAPLIVRINQKADDRSAAQNRLYWAWLEQIRLKTGNSKNQTHLFFKKKYLSRIYVESRQETAEKYYALQNFKDVIQSFDGAKRLQLEKDYQQLVHTFIKDHLQSRKATIKEFTKYLDKINIYAHRDLGIKLTIPDDLKWCYQDDQ